ncbi:MAG: FlgO family outer membrane protein [Fidelibacterota bacterium]
MSPKKLISFLIMFSFLCYDIALAFAPQDDKITIAIVDFRNTGQDMDLNYLEKTIPEAIITRMARGGQLEIVERARMQEALKEMQLGMAGVVDEQTAVELGRAVGASAILLGSFVSIGEVIRINARLIDVQTSRIIKAESVQGQVGEEIFDLMDQMAESMETQLVGETGRTVQVQPIPVTREERKEEKERKPLFSRWWFWAGVAVAGGVAVLLLTQEKTSTVNITVNIP